MESCRSESTGSKTLWRGEENVPRIHAIGHFRAPCSRKQSKQTRLSAGRGVKIVGGEIIKASSL